MNLRSVCNAGVYGVWGCIGHGSVCNAGVGLSSLKVMECGVL